ncbi:MAG: efflux RND transporter periplasmic adaptor subunit [Methyloligellaceae bacterium]
MKLSVLRTVGFAAVLCLAGLANSPVVAQAPSLVRVEAVRYEPLTQTVPVIGRLVSLRSGDIAARIAGPVERIFVDVGSRVTKGQIIAVLDAEVLKADKALAASELAEARADHKTWDAEVELARTDLKRQGGLKKSVAFSQAKFEDAQKKVAVAESKVKRAEAKIAIKEAALERKILDVEYAVVRAPYDGVVVQRHTEMGAYVNKGAALVRLIGDRALEIEADVPYLRLSGLTVGRIVDVTLDDGSRHRAKVRSVLPSENPLTRTRAVRFKGIFESTSRPLAESQSVTIEVPIGAERRVLTVHKDAILKRQGGDLVYVVANDTATPRVVRLGEAVGNRIEVLDGLKDGDRVVVRGNERLRPGAKVRIEKGST